ncbi:DUF1993 domain-containing protein [Woeseia oceani]|uniref:DUF1993 domain-containing protein n=1 Tax=Woeseia oceani TaxID=1548547 RepID=A0A193LFK3_9GAMM|nr:DUF1993 domain-containing protein [Woeseia oceani]ANO51236.1 hypothetical protein BA177_08505 [Woeseia oceani]
MSISVYDQTIGVMSRMLLNLDAIIGKAEAYAEQDKIDPNVLLQARLYPTMLNLIAQVRIATDIGKGAAARLSGSEVPVWEDKEVTFADLHARIGQALDYFAGFKPEQFDGAEERAISLKIGGQALEFTGQSYVLGFVLPNFYFHVTTAYNILRHNGLDIGKRDFLGAR